LKFSFLPESFRQHKGHYSFFIIDLNDKAAEKFIAQNSMNIHSEIISKLKVILFKHKHGVPPSQHARKFK
jgi:hypothetical protein